MGRPAKQPSHRFLDERVRRHRRQAAVCSDKGWHGTDRGGMAPSGQVHTQSIPVTGIISLCPQEVQATPQGDRSAHADGQSRKARRMPSPVDCCRILGLQRAASAAGLLPNQQGPGNPPTVATRPGEVGARAWTSSISAACYLGHLFARQQRGIEIIGNGWLAYGKVCGGTLRVRLLDCSALASRRSLNISVLMPMSSCTISNQIAGGT